ncbi:YCF48-related protein [Paraburkholderia caffeinilytica]|uniref:YCF48-related protein n=1 Tax=Paraburkholderia caffeinilytica TaxID=1761016 RepID=UPI0038B9B077
MNHASAARSALVAAGWAAHAVAEPDAPASAVIRKDPFVDPLDAPAIMHAAVAGRPLMTVARAGTRLVAVGMRGLIVVSDDEGKNWSQVGSPVRSDLVALSFPTSRDGWAVGHDGVVLHTADGGGTWVRQFDGRMAAASLVNNYKAKIAAGDAALQPYVDQLLLNYKAGPSLPLLGVWFSDPRHGIAVGPFGTAIVTDDGGKTWMPMLERIDNPQFLHLNAVRGVAGGVFIAGEKGTVFRFDPASGKFARVESGYGGSFFGIAGDERALFAYGLRGTIYRSTDQGASWAPLKSPLHGAVTSAVPIESRHAVVFVSSSGEATLYDETTDTFHPVKTGRPAAFTGVLAPGGDALVLTSLGGASLASAR